MNIDPKRVPLVAAGQGHAPEAVESSGWGVTAIIGLVLGLVALAGFVAMVVEWVAR